MLELYLIRHPETEAFERKRVAGHRDTSLRKGWQTGVDEVARKLAAIGVYDAFYSSDCFYCGPYGR